MEKRANDVLRTNKEYATKLMNEIKNGDSDG